MAFVAYFRPRNLRKAAGVVRAVLDDPARKPAWTMAREAAAFGLAKGEVGRYFRSRIYRRGAVRPLTYLSEREGRELRRLAKQHEAARVFDDKLAFQRAFDGVPGVCVPRFLGHVEDSEFHAPDGERFPAASVADVEAVLGRLFRGLDPDATAFAKPRSDYGGKGVLKLERGEDPGRLYQALGRGDYVFQQTVRQHLALNAVYADSLNSVRVITCSLPSGPEVACARIRFGQGGNVADNASSGGIACGIALDSGRLLGPGSTHFEYGGTLFHEHPDTGHPLVGFEVPLFHQAVEMALQAATDRPYPITGWDVGISPEGPVLIEGNSRANYHGDEAVAGGYLGMPVVRALIHHLTDGRGL